MCVTHYRSFILNDLMLVLVKYRLLFNQFHCKILPWTSFTNQVNLKSKSNITFEKPPEPMHLINSKSFKPTRV